MVYRSDTHSGVTSEFEFGSSLMDYGHAAESFLRAVLQEWPPLWVSPTIPGEPTPLPTPHTVLC
jgi:hypothetical protein